jgi:hypothetical protein
MYKLMIVGIFFPMLILTAPNAYAVTSADRYTNGFSHGEQQAATDFQNHSPFNLDCGKHTRYYCIGYSQGYNTKWNSLVQTKPHTIPSPPITSRVNANISRIAPSNSNTSTISIHTVNTIQASNSSILAQEEPIIRKIIASNINNAILMAEGSVKDNISVSVNTKVINQLANRVSTTQGIDFTKELVATELAAAINTIKTNTIVVDNQAVCTGIYTPNNRVCAFTISIHG